MFNGFFDNFDEKIKNFCKKIDFFGVTFNFRVDKQSTHGSFTGGVIFFLYFIIAISFVTQSLGEFLRSSKMNIIFIDQSVNPSPILNISNSNFAFAMRITFDNDTNIDDSYLGDLLLTKTNYVLKRPNYKTKFPLSHRPCVNEDFKSNAHSVLFQKKNITYFTCFNYDKNLTLHGIYTDPLMAYIEYLVYLNPKYFSNYKLIEDAFKNNQFKLTMYYISTLIDVSDIKQPVFYKIDTVYTYLDLDYFKRINIDFQELIFQEDLNLFLEDYKNYTYMPKLSIEDTMVTIKDRYQSTIEDRFKLVKFFLRAVNFRKTIKRGFQKIPEFLAILGGLLVNLLAGLGIVIALYNEFKAKQVVMNKICKYGDALKENNIESLKYLISGNTYSDSGDKQDKQDKPDSDIIFSSRSKEKKDSIEPRKESIFTFAEHKAKKESTLSGVELEDLPSFKEKLNIETIDLRESRLEKNVLLSTNNNSMLFSFFDLVKYYVCCEKIEKKNLAFENASRS